MIQRLIAFYKNTLLYLATHKRTKDVLIAGVVLAFVFLTFYSVLLAAPSKFPEQTLVHVKKGLTLSDVARMLKEEHVVNNASLFELVAHLFAKEGVVVAGEYSFTNPQNILTVARRLTSGDFEIAPVRIRVEEGMSVAQITEVLREELIDFDAETFYELASSKEGRLYPDTYFFMPGDEPELVLSVMESNFELQIQDATLATAIASFGKPFEEVLTMASLLEKEAATVQDKRLIAGILWRRLENDMPLQVDAVFPYIIGKNTFTLTREDLQTDSPYNTYTNKGLPPGPIGSPSVESIMAAVTPLETSYVYYLSDYEGITHYSTTYEQHLTKKRKYLD